MKYVNFLFHIYQPPTQNPQILERIVDECYMPLVELFVEFSDLRFSLNIPFSLVEQLERAHPEVLDRIRQAHADGTLELTATAAYHPILPLIPEDEVQRQLEINLKGNRRYLSQDFDPEGVFPPEMAFDGGLAGLLAQDRYRWAVADDGILGHFDRPIPYDWIYQFAGIGVFLRSNDWSNRFATADPNWREGADAFRDILDGLEQWMGPRDGYLVIALDGETFGHHHKRLNADFLRGLFEPFREHQDRIRLSHLSSLFDNPRFPKRSGFIPPGSWSFDAVDIHRGDHFAWWKAIGNEVHAYQWALLDLVRNEVGKSADEGLRREMDKALYSCTFWYASIWQFNPDSAGQVYKGAFLLMKILQAAVAQPERIEPLERGERMLRDLVTRIEIERHKMLSIDEV